MCIYIFQNPEIQKMSAVAPAASPVTGATSVSKDEHHERIVLEPSPLQTKEIEEAKGSLIKLNMHFRLVASLLFD